MHAIIKFINFDDPQASGEPVTVFVFDFTDKSPDKVSHYYLYMKLQVFNL